MAVFMCHFLLWRIVVASTVGGRVPQKNLSWYSNLNLSLSQTATSAITLRLNDASFYQNLLTLNRARLLNSQYNRGSSVFLRERASDTDSYSSVVVNGQLEELGAWRADCVEVSLSVGDVSQPVNCSCRGDWLNAFQQTLRRLVPRWYASTCRVQRRPHSLATTRQILSQWLTLLCLPVTISIDTHWSVVTNQCNARNDRFYRCVLAIASDAFMAFVEQESPANAKGTRDSSACMKAHCEQM